eukprot:748205-Rhodomonas_salina.2
MAGRSANSPLDVPVIGNGSSAAPGPIVPYTPGSSSSSVSGAEVGEKTVVETIRAAAENAMYVGNGGSSAEGAASSPQPAASVTLDPENPVIKEEILKMVAAYLGNIRRVGYVWSCSDTGNAAPQPTKATPPPPCSLWTRRM